MTEREPRDDEELERLVRELMENTLENTSFARTTALVRVTRMLRNVVTHAELSLVSREDIVQEALVRVLSEKGRAAFRVARNPVNYLIGVTRRVEADFLRDSVRRKVRTEWYARQAGPPSADRHVANRLDEVLDAVANLGPDERELFRLRFVENLDIKEISRRLDLTWSAAAKRVQRLLETLKKLARTSP